MAAKGTFDLTGVESQGQTNGHPESESQHLSQSHSPLLSAKRIKTPNPLAEPAVLHPSLRPVEAKGPFGDQIQHLTDQIKDYEQKTDRLKTTLDRLDLAMTRLAERKALYKEFEDDLSEVETRLDRRFEELSAAESLVRLFRQTPDESPVHPRKRHNLMRENEDLIEIALAQEREMLVLKMKLRLWHDHRDLMRMRRILNKLEGGGGDYSEDEDITSKLKTSIRNLRDAIPRERERIRVLKLDDGGEHDAAAIIQKTWRGYAYRLALNPKDDASPTTPRGVVRPAEAPAAASKAK
jgi:cysteinyl-tRNA synthetase